MQFISVNANQTLNEVLEGQMTFQLHFQDEKFMDAMYSTAAAC